MKLFQINATVNSGSTGRIAEDIGMVLIADGHESYIAAFNTNRPSKSEVIAIGTAWDRKLHGLKTRLFDRHGFGSKTASRKLVENIKTINPDIVHLHNVHGYYLNVEILFNFLKEFQKPVVWTFHDCWPFTGHCSYFDAVNCFKWQTECNHCPNKKGYPASWGLDQSKRNFYDKQEIFNGIDKLQIITPSKWLAEHVQNSFLKNYQVKVIHNGIDLNNFSSRQDTTEIKEKWKLSNKKIVLGVASQWDKRKGLQDFIQVRQALSKDIEIVLIGLSTKQMKVLPEGVTGIARTESINELAELYSASNVFINPTYVDNFPTTNIEALACGSPVITYNTGGSPEAIDEQSGMVVNKGDIDGLAKAIDKVLENGKEHYAPLCKTRAEQMFNKDDRYNDYLKLYEAMLS